MGLRLAHDPNGDVPRTVTKIAAYDTGVLTGVVVWDTDVGEIVEHHELAEVELYPYVWRTTSALSHVQIEWFQVSARTIRTQFTPDPIWHAGMIRAECIRNGVPFAFSGTSMVMTRFNDEALKRAGLYIPGGKGHWRDATRHLCKYLRDHNLISVERFLIDGVDDAT